MTQTNKDINKIAENLLVYHFEVSWDLDDIMESLQDYDLLTEKWKKVKKRLREITWKWTPDEFGWEERMMCAWLSFPKSTQKILLQEYDKKTMNKRAMKFIRSKVLSLKQTDD